MDDKDSMSAKSGRAEIRAVPDPEVTEKVRRRRFTAAYKSRILKEAELCKQSGELGALLRREGLYYSNIAKWRRQAESGLLPKKRGPQGPDPAVRRIAELEKENARLVRKLKQAELIIDVQKKVADLLKGEGGETS